MRGLGAILLASAAAIAASLPQRIDAVLAGSPAAQTSFWGIRIVDLASGRTLYERNPKRFFVPASNTKLFTTALALTRLGPDFTFQTRALAAAAPDADGRIRSDLVLMGGGDPNLSARTIPYRTGPATGDPLAALADLAAQVAAHGVKRIDGDIVGDDTWYVWEPYGEGWAIDDPQYDYGAPVSALSVNDNAFTVSVRPGAQAGDPAALVWSPPLEFYATDNRIRTVERGERRIRFARDAGGFQLRLWGTVPLGDKGEDLVLGIEDPARYAAMAFRQALEAAGIVVGGSTRARHRFPEEPDSAGVEGTELARRVSAPLVEDLRITDKVSQNLHAELALRAVGRARRGMGSREAGLEEMQGFLGEAGIEPESYHLSDGSGLARLNLVTPATVVNLLRHMYDSPARETWLELLPIGGRDGTLATRFGQEKSAERIHAKTGSMSHVSALSGYIERRGGKWVAFSILVNNYGGRTAEVRAVMDRVCTLLLE